MICKALIRAINNLARTVVRAETKQTMILKRIAHNTEHIMADNTQIKADLKEALLRQGKTFDEIVNLQAGVDKLNAKIVELEAVIAEGGPVDQELVDLVAQVKTQAGKVDDLIPDLPTPGRPPTPAPNE